MVNQAHMRWDEMSIRDNLGHMRYDGCGGRARRAEHITIIEGASSRGRCVDARSPTQPGARHLATTRLGASLGNLAPIEDRVWGAMRRKVLGRGRHWC